MKTLLCAAAAAALLVLASCSSTGETCARTLIAGELCGQDLVLFCEQSYDVDVNADVCDQVLRDDGQDPASYVPTPIPTPEPARFGEASTLTGPDGEKLKVTVSGALLPVTPGEYEEPDGEFVGVQVRVKNAGDQAVAQSMSATLRLANGRKLEPAFVINGDCTDGLDVELSPGDTVTLCVPFDVPLGDEPAAFIVNAFGITDEPQIARWTYDG